MGPSLNQVIHRKGQQDRGKSGKHILWGNEDFSFKRYWGRHCRFFSNIWSATMETNVYNLFQLLDKAKTERQVMNGMQASAKVDSHHRPICPYVSLLLDGGVQAETVWLPAWNIAINSLHGEGSGIRWLLNSKLPGYSDAMEKHLSHVSGNLPAK